MNIAINYLAVLASAVVMMGIGWSWYGPIFGRQWRHLLGFTKESMKKMKMSMAQGMTGLFVGSLVTSYIFAHFVKLLGVTTISGGLQLGFWIWLGFIVTTLSANVFAEERPLKLYFISIGYYLVSFLAVGAILAGWQ